MAEKPTRKQAGKSTKMTPPESGLSSGSGIPCGACKFLRRRCVNGCVFAPYFSPEQGLAMFAAVHKVFGACNVAKLLTQLPDYLRQHAIETVSYEAQARLSDPVFGCVSTIISLQQQVAALRMELATVQNQLLNNRLMVSNTIHGSAHQLEPVYSNGSSAYNLENDNQNAFYSQPSFNPLQLSEPFHKSEEETGDPFAFADQMLLSK